MDLNIAGKKAAIAAATKGLGLATARSLQEEGVQVAICGREKSRVDQALAELGGDCIGIVTDVSTRTGAESFILQAIDKMGQVDILVTNCTSVSSQEQSWYMPLAAASSWLIHGLICGSGAESLKRTMPGSRVWLRSISFIRSSSG